MNFICGALLLGGLSGHLLAQQCPEGFLDAGELSAEVGAGKYQEVQVTKELLLPQGIRIDDSYRQKTISATSDGGASNLRVVDIPAGFHLIPNGARPGGGWWSIDNPKLEEAKFKIDLYVNSGGRTPPPAAGARTRAGASTSNVRVRVCIKVLK